METDQAAWLLDNIDLQSALEQETGYKPEIVPKQLVDRALSGKITPDVAEAVEGQVRANALPDRASLLAAYKWRRGRRPVPCMALKDRVLYRGIANLLGAWLPPAVRDVESHGRFSEAPIKAECKWVVVTDLANYYATIDIQRLCLQILERTGKWHAVAWLESFWKSLSGGVIGIPQINQASDLFADVYADALHAALARRGLIAWRFADDFRIAAGSFGECIGILETIDEEARKLGLFINERKTFTMTRDKYIETRNAPTAAIAETFAAVRERLTVETDGYDWTVIEPGEADVMREGAHDLLNEWQAEVPTEGEQSAAEALGTTKNVAIAFAVLGALQDPRGLSAVPLTIRFEPQMMPTIASYLAAVAATAPVDVSLAIQRCISEHALTKWQEVWLASVLENYRIPRNVEAGFGNTSVDLVAWLRKQTRDPVEAVRAQAIWSLATSWDSSIHDWREASAYGAPLYMSPYLESALEGTFGAASERQGFGSARRLDTIVRREAKAWIGPPF